MLLGVLADHAVRGKKRGQPGHAFPHASNPAARTSSIVARIESRDNLLPLQVLGMGLPSEYDLDRAFPIGQDGHKPLRIMQEKVGTLVRRKTASKAQSQSVSVERLSGPRKILRGSSPACKLPGVPFANVVNERLTAISPKPP